jgi:glutamine transport system permease protein
MELVSFQFDWSVLFPYAGYYVSGLGVTLMLAIVSLVLALVAGLLLALMATSKFAPLAAFSAGYVWLFRAVPIYVFLLWVYYGLPLLFSVNLDPITAGLICIGSQYAAFQSEVFRAGLQAISKGQMEAAYSVGLTRLQGFRTVVFPQMLRLVLPPSGNNLVNIVKDTSLLAVIGVFEITRYTQLAISYNFRAFEFYTALAVIYAVVVLVLGYGVTVLERRFAIPGH